VQVPGPNSFTGHLLKNTLLWITMQRHGNELVPPELIRHGRSTYISLAIYNNLGENQNGLGMITKAHQRE
jgi:hypothetical protein